MILSPRSIKITWAAATSLKGHVTRYMVRWIQRVNSSDSVEDGHKIVKAGKPYLRETVIGGLTPHNIYSFSVREAIGEGNWGEFSDPSDVIMPEDGTS